jgi:hypothetical protein
VSEPTSAARLIAGQAKAAAKTSMADNDLERGFTVSLFSRYFYVIARREVTRSPTRALKLEHFQRESVNSSRPS